MWYVSIKQFYDFFLSQKRKEALQLASPVDGEELRKREREKVYVCPLRGKWEYGGGRTIENR